MLGIVAELKRGLMVNDFPALIESERDRLGALEKTVDSGEPKAESENPDENAMDTSKS
jgi:hypothetical protein